MASRVFAVRRALDEVGGRRRILKVPVLDAVVRVAEAARDELRNAVFRMRNYTTGEWAITETRKTLTPECIAADNVVDPRCVPCVARARLTVRVESNLGIWEVLREGYGCERRDGSAQRMAEGYEGVGGVGRYDSGHVGKEWRGDDVEGGSEAGVDESAI